jgi:hypothetical protein
MTPPVLAWGRRQDRRYVNISLHKLIHIHAVFHMLALCTTYWCRLLCSLTLVVYIVSLSVFDAFVHFTPVVAVVVLCSIVYHQLVPPVVHV